MAKSKKPAPATGEAVFEVLSRLDHNGEIYEPGDQVALDTENAEVLIKQRVVRVPAASKDAATN
jgi:hypothetical protein